MPDYHALITKMANELDQCHRLLMDDRRQRHPLADYARTALAAAPKGEPSDDQLDLVVIAIQALTPHQPDATTHDLHAVDRGREILRQSLARWGRPAAAPVPDFGEVAAALKVIDKMQQEWVLLGNDDDGTASPSLSMPISLRRFTVALFRAATLLQQQAAPVPVSERLPGDALCWWYEPDEDDDGSGYGGNWTLLRIRGGVSCYTHWLPANALPLPAPEGGESQP